MKKVSLMLGALALVLGISQCKKQESPVQAGEKQYIEVTANNGNDGSKVNVDFTSVPTVMNLTWEKGDVITVSGGAVGTLTLDDGVGTAQGHFSGEIEKKNDNELVFSYRKAIPSKDDDVIDFNAQDGTQAWIKDNLYLETKAAYNDNGKYSLLMEMPYAVLKLDLSVFVGTQNDVTIKVGDDIVATVENLAAANAGLVYVAVPANGTEQTYTFSGNGRTVEKTWELASSTYYTAEGGNAVAIVPDMKFTVDANGTKVEFAPGNLQYLGKSDGTGTWRFAEHQWDYMGAGPSATSNKGNVDLSSLGYLAGMYNTGSGNAGGSETDADKAAARDLFGWGCTGYQDTRMDNHTDWYQTNYQPYSTSKSSVSTDDYNYYGYGPDFYSGSKYNLTVENKSDWGCLAIGTDPAGTWRTLSNAEWVYLFDTRTVNGGTGEGKSYQRATINNDASDGSEVYGMLLYPDGYTAQTGATSYTKADWSAMESAGVVFLPAAGYRSGTSLLNVGSNGYYWSGSCVNNMFSLYLYFDSGDVNPKYCTRYCGLSVRLVR